MPHAIRLHETGGPDALRWEEVEVPSPRPGEVRLRHTAVGLNFIDVYHRSGLYPLADLPVVPGLEAVGVVEELGPGVADLRVGDRVGYGTGPLGAYAEERVMPATTLLRLPDAIDDMQGAALLLKGLTAHYLLRRTYRVKPGDAVLVHAAAGGVGLLLCQWAKHLGATVIGTVGSPEKAQLARENGCDHPVLYRDENVVERVRAITDGIGVEVVYDSVGKDTFASSLDCLRPLGMLVSFGQSSGSVPPFNPGLLGAKGSLFFTRPSLMTYAAERAELIAMAEELFEVVTAGVLRVSVRQRYKLADAATAHRDLEARKTTGSTVLLP